MYISINEGGLANRIKSLVSCIKLGIENNENYYVKWNILDNYKKNNHILNCEFNKLFSNNIEINVYDKNFKIYNHHCLVITDNDNITNNFNTFNSNLKKKKFTKNDKLNRNIDFMYNDIPENVKINYIKYFKILKLNKKLEQEVNTFSKKFNDKTISIHIRSWNRNGEGERRKGLFKLNKYIEIMNKYPNYNFYLSSDSSKVIEELKNKYQERLIIYPRKTSLDNSRDFPEGVEEDLIELYLLSKNNFIIGSHFSTFTEVAWWLAECPKNIIII